MSTNTDYTIVHDIGELVTEPVEREEGGGPEPPDEPVVVRKEEAAVVAADGEVVTTGPSEDLIRKYPPENAAAAVDAAGNCVLPGFVDPHTHAVFAGDRSDEFEAKLRGKEYQEILAEGGGILRTVRAVREASEDDLVANLREHLDVMLAHGTTTVEVKSGYGLDIDTELKLLSAIDRAGTDHPVDVVPTFMGAHAVPEDEEPEAYTERVIEDQLPAVEKQGIAEFCDVFCEEGAFTLEQSRRVLEAGVDHGLAPKIHADEFANLGGAGLAADLGAVSADHLLQSGGDDVTALLSAEVTPVVLPGTAFGLGGEYPDLGPYRRRGTVPAVGSDFNPNCHARSMGFAATLACVGMGMTPAEAVVGITSRAAAAIDRPNRGVIESGAPADLAVLDAPTYRYLAYDYDVNVVSQVLKAGVPVAGG